MNMDPKNVDHRDDVTVYQVLRDANASARADTWRRSKAIGRPLLIVGASILKACLAVLGRRFGKR